MGDIQKENLQVKKRQVPLELNWLQDLDDCKAGGFFVDHQVGLRRIRPFKSFFGSGPN